MKKFLLLLLGLTLCVGVATACDQALIESTSSPTTTSSSDSSSGEEEVFYTVTFKQDGYADIVKQVKEGETLVNVPAPQATTPGYTYSWSVSDFSNITKNIEVTAIKTPIEYTIYFDAGEGTVEPRTQKVKFNESPERFPTPTRDGYAFVTWLYKGDVVDANDVWTIHNDGDQNVGLTAEWQKIAEKFTVTFVQSGQAPVTFTDIEEGSTFDATQIPTIQGRTGYTVSWNSSDLAKLSSPITENIIVSSVEAANEYEISYGGLEDGTLNGAATKKVTFDAAIGELATATRTGYHFKGWTYDDGQTVITLTAADLWQIPQNATLKAKWEAKKCQVTLSLGGGSVTGSTTLELTYGQQYNLPTPSKAGYTFVEWRNGTTKVATSGKWAYEGETLTLTAVWTEEGSWTPNY